MTDKDKQIEEIAITLGVDACKKTGCINCAVNSDCIWSYQATRLYNLGYRKASDVVWEIFEEAIKLAKEIADNSAVLAELEENPIKRIESKGEQIGALLVLEILAELKKKYMEGEMRTYDKRYQRRRYTKTCPFCKSICENFIGSNLFCNCNAKYYYFDNVWLNRNTGESIKESEDTE